MSRLEPINGTEIIVTPDNTEIRLGHTYYEVAQIKRIILMLQPKNFIEIGIHEGGLSWNLLNWKLSSLNYVGMELSCYLIRPEVIKLYKEKEAKLICGDCFNPETVQFISGLESKIIYCDGGMKAKEIVVYSQCLSPGDCIMSHDYWSGETEIIDVKYPRAEVTPEDVSFLRTDNYEELHLPGTRVVAFRKI